MHREYLREVHPARLNTLILTGELLTYLADLNEQAQKRLDTIMEQMKATEGVTEELKCTRQGYNQFRFPLFLVSIRSCSLPPVEAGSSGTHC